MFFFFLNIFVWYFWIMLKYNWHCTRCKHSACSKYWNTLLQYWTVAHLFSYWTHDGGSMGNSATHSSLRIPRKVLSTGRQPQKYLQAARSYLVGKGTLKICKSCNQHGKSSPLQILFESSPWKESQVIHLFYHWIRSLYWVLVTKKSRRE